MRQKISDMLQLISFIFAIVLSDCASAMDSDVMFLKGWELPKYLVTKDESRKDISSLLKLSWEDSYPVKLKGSSNVLTISSCADYFKVKDNTPKPVSSLDFPPFTFLSLQCEATLLASTAPRSKKNMLNSIEFNDAFADLLPSEIEFGQDIPSGQTWREVSRASFIKDEGAYLYFKGPDYGYHLYPIAFGDFDSDGYMDLILLIKTFALQGNYIHNAAFMLSRKEERSKLRLVKQLSN